MMSVRARGAPASRRAVKDRRASIDLVGSKERIEDLGVMGARAEASYVRLMMSTRIGLWER